MVEHVRVAVIGGGAVGCSALYHFAQRGWTDALLLEQNELTSGSTWHAAGNCPTFSTAWGILKLQKYSADLYRRLAEDPAYPIGYHVTGSLRLSHGEERLAEFRHVCGMARANGIDYALLSPAEARDRHPLLELHDLNAALWDPLDGDIDPAQLTQALAAAARRLGARGAAAQPRRRPRCAPPAAAGRCARRTAVKWSRRWSSTPPATAPAR